MGLCGSKSSGHDDDDSHKIQLGGRNVQVITTMEMWEEKLSEAKRDSKIVVANFSASWCVPCKKIAPSYCEVADKYPSIIFLTVDVDELADFSSSWDVKATPTFFFLKDGRQVDKFVGANKEELGRKVAAASGSANRSGD